jgi:hypothetical protein
MKTKNLTEINLAFTNLLSSLKKIIKHGVLCLVYFIVCFLFNPTLLALNNSVAKPDTAKWRNPTAGVLKVFTSKDKFKNREVLKLYDDNTYEFVVYQRIPKLFQMKRETGVYKWEGKSLLIADNCNFKLHSTHYLQKYIFKKGKGLYATKKDALLNGDEIYLQETESAKYKAAFYIDPDQGAIVMNKEAPQKIDLADLVTNLTKGLETDQQKVDVIVSFIKNSIDYDFYNVNQSADVKEVIAGRKRLGICYSYATVANKLLSLCGVECETASGIAKNSVANVVLELSTNHAWNIITINGTKQIYDLSWSDITGDSYMNINPEIMIYTHFPNNPKHQLLENSISKNEFDHSPYVTFNGNSTIHDFSPAKAINYATDVFTVTFDTIIENVRVRNTKDSTAFDVIYEGEIGWSKTKTIKFSSVDNVIVDYDNGKTIVSIPITQKTNAIEVNFNDITLGYMVIKDSQKSLYEKYIRNCNPLQADSYVRGVLSAIYLNDMPKLKEFVGDTNTVFFNTKGKLALKKNVIEKIMTWDGLISDFHVVISDPIENYIIACNKKFIFEKSEGRYVITGIK